MINWSEENLLKQKIYYMEDKLHILYNIKSLKDKISLHEKRYWFNECDYKYLEYYKERYSKVCSRLSRINNILRNRNIELDLNLSKYCIIDMYKLIEITKSSEYINVDNIDKYILDVDKDTKWKLLGYKQ
jgi:hypothetical protein